MRWTAKKKLKLQEGDIWREIRFAFIPVRVEDKWVWLEKYVAVYEYTLYCYGIAGEWRGKWVRIYCVDVCSGQQLGFIPKAKEAQSQTHSYYKKE